MTTEQRYTGPTICPKCNSGSQLVRHPGNNDDPFIRCWGCGEIFPYPKPSPVEQADNLGKQEYGERDWPEDDSHENGGYENKCCHCGNIFYGHKRRVSCKLCCTPSDKATQDAGDDPYDAFQEWAEVEAEIFTVGTDGRIGLADEFMEELRKRFVPRQQWMPISEAPKGKRVLVLCQWENEHGKLSTYRTIALYRPEKWEDASCCEDPEDWAMEDEDGNLWWPEGWYESAAESDQEYAIKFPITGWMHLPPPPDEKEGR